MEVSKLRVSISPADCYIPKDVKLVPSSVEWESLSDLIPEYWMPSREAMATICIVFGVTRGSNPWPPTMPQFYFFFICICDDDDGFDSINRIKKNCYSSHTLLIVISNPILHCWSQWRSLNRSYSLTESQWRHASMFNPFFMTYSKHAVIVSSSLHVWKRWTKHQPIKGKFKESMLLWLYKGLYLVFYLLFFFLLRFPLSLCKTSQRKNVVFFFCLLIFGEFIASPGTDIMVMNDWWSEFCIVPDL